VREDSAAKAGNTNPSARFGTTRWSVVLSSGKGSSETEKAHAALSQLCRIYWRPIFTYICRQGYTVENAQDLTQDFFMTLLGGRLLQKADPSRGRFRSLLLKALQNFLSDAHGKRSAKKRGGGLKFVSWDDWMTDGQSHFTLPVQAVESWAPERLFDVRWAAAVVEQALRRLREECETRGRGRVFDALSRTLAADRVDTSYAELGKALQVDEPTVKHLLHQLRQRYRALLRSEVSRTVETEADLDEEIRYLCTMLASNERK
jgi:RNA polymerase sigma-70 factor (ECF subfamily)